MPTRHDETPPARTLDDRFLPLLEALMRGMRERTEILARFEDRMGRLEPGPDTSALVAEAARQRRELQTTRRELARLGCSLLGGAQHAD